MKEDLVRTLILLGIAPLDAEQVAMATDTLPDIYHAYRFWATHWGTLTPEMIRHEALADWWGNPAISLTFKRLLSAHPSESAI